MLSWVVFQSVIDVVETRKAHVNILENKLLLVVVYLRSLFLFALEEV